MRGGGLHLRRGDPVREVVEVARAAHASTVHVAEDFAPTGGSATSISRLSSRTMAYPWCAPGRRMPWNLGLRAPAEAAATWNCRLPGRPASASAADPRAGRSAVTNDRGARPHRTAGGSADR
jgi:hypothetical protein